jgi:hypothetical protein
MQEVAGSIPAVSTRRSSWFGSLCGTSAGVKSRRSRFDSSPNHRVGSPAKGKVQYRPLESQTRADWLRAERGGCSLTGQSARLWPGYVPVRARPVSLGSGSLRSHCPGSVAQGNRATPYEGVRGGSIPPGPARGLSGATWGRSSVEERCPVEADAAGSIPVVLARVSGLAKTGTPHGALV